MTALCLEPRFLISSLEFRLILKTSCVSFGYASENVSLEGMLLFLFAFGTILYECCFEELKFATFMWSFLYSFFLGPAVVPGRSIVAFALCWILCFE